MLASRAWMARMALAAGVMAALLSRTALAQDASPSPVPTYAASSGSAAAPAALDSTAMMTSAAAGLQGTAPAPSSGLEVTPLAAAVAGATAGALLAWAFTRSMERAKQEEAFKVALLQKRVDTALRVQTDLHYLGEAFLDQAAECKDVKQLQESYVRTRRKIISLMAQTGFTNPLIYGYVNGILHANLLHDVDKMTRTDDISALQVNYRRTLRFLSLCYSLALYRSTKAIWELETDTARLAIVEDLAKQDVQRWYDGQRDMRKFSSVLETLPAEDLKAKICAT